MADPIVNKNLSKTETAVQKYLDSIGVKASIMYCGETIRDNWRCDTWRITVVAVKVSHSFEYCTDLGHRKIDSFKRKCPVYPAVADLLYSLQSGTSACEQSFDDWCADYGYDTDSRKALDVYLLCQQNSAKYNQLFSREQREAIAELMQDY